MNHILQIFLVILFHFYIDVYARRKTTTPATTDPPLFLDDYGDDDWLEIDDMRIVSKYFRSGLSDKSFRWELGIIPYVFHPGDFDEEKENLIVSIMDYISEKTCIRFVRNDDKTYENYLYIRNGYGFYAAVGNTRSGPQWLCLQTNEQTLSINHPGYYYTGAVAHELLHSIGFEHEHQRDDRDDYINIHYENMDNTAGVLRNFLKGRDLGIQQENFSLPYNYESIMQYPKSAFSNNGKPTMTPKGVLSEGVPYPLFGAMDSNGAPVLGQTSFLSQGDILMIQNMYAGICEGTDEDANGGPLTSKEIPNRFRHLPKPRQLQPTTPKTQSTSTPTTQTTPTTPVTTIMPTSAMTTSTESETDSNEIDQTTKISNSTSKPMNASGTTPQSAVDNGLGVINGMKPASPTTPKPI